MLVTPSATLVDRRGRIVWLFAGWLAFWLTAVLVPCCETFAAGNSAGTAFAQTHDVHEGTHGTWPHTYPQQQDFDCPDLTAATIPAAAANLPVGQQVDPVPAIAVESRTVPVGVKPLRVHSPPPASPGVPVYLGTLRLRI